MTVPTAIQVHEALTLLGTTADEVAAFLRTAGIHGRRCNSNECPIAEYLNAQFPGNKFAVGTSGVYWARHGLSEQHTAQPRPVWDFRGQFDKGYYPYLNKIGA